VVDGVVTITGLTGVKAGELLVFENDIKGMALNLNYDNVSAVLFGDEREIKPGQVVKGTGNIISVPTGIELLGRVVNALGEPIDGKSAFTKNCI
jgi:F-type H+-transporting ATPase subunit alpha